MARIAPDLAELAEALDHTTDLTHWFDQLQRCLLARVPLGGTPEADEERVLKALAESQLLAAWALCRVLNPGWQRRVRGAAREALDVLERLVRANERDQPLEDLQAELGELAEAAGDQDDPDADCFLLLIDAVSDEAAFADDTIVEAVRQVLTLLLPSRVRSSLLGALREWLLDPTRAPHDLTVIPAELRAAEEADYQHWIAEQRREGGSVPRCPLA